MSIHAYCRNWLHIIWATKNREKFLLATQARIDVSKHLKEYAQSKGIYLRINHVCPDHVHALIDLPEDLCVKDAVKLLKGESSHFINQSRLMQAEFHWQRGYGAFSVSHSMVGKVCDYIANQGEHHRKKRFDEEIKAFVRAYGLVWRDDEGGYEKIEEQGGQS